MGISKVPLCMSAYGETFNNLKVLPWDLSGFLKRFQGLFFETILGKDPMGPYRAPGPTKVPVSIKNI